MNVTLRTILCLLTGLVSLSLATSAQADEPSSAMARSQPNEVTMNNGLIEVAVSPHYQWNGVAVSPHGRLFASFPRWLSDETISVGEILTDGTIRPFPGGDWNTWHPKQSSEHPGHRFISVNAIYTDRANNLWVVDPAAPAFGPIVSNGPKLVQIDLNTNQVTRVYPLDETVAPPGSYVNDVRVGAGHAYLTESGRGAIIVVELESGRARRLLEDHPSTKADPQIVPVIEGRKMIDAQGKPPKLNANDIELTPDEQYLLYQPSVGPTWFRIATEALLDTTLTGEQLGARVNTGHETMPVGGTTMDAAGNIYLADVERRAIWQQRPDGTLRLIVRDVRLVWHDAMDIDADSYLYIPVSQVHRMPMFNSGQNAVARPFRLYKVNISN
jgi:sugar lactone lactonase YvrE